VSSIPDANTVFGGQEMKHRDREKREETENRQRKREIEQTDRRDRYYY
jgi:hypothetical protein